MLQQPPPPDSPPPPPPPPPAFSAQGTDTPPWHMLLHTRKEHLDSIHTELFGLLGAPAPAWLPPMHTRLVDEGGAANCPTAAADIWAHTMALDADEDHRQKHLEQLRDMKQRGGGGPTGPQVGPSRGSSSFVPAQYVPPSRAAQAPAPARKAAPAPAPVAAPAPKAALKAVPAAAFDASALAEAKARAAAAAQRITAGLGSAASPPAAKRPRT